MHQRYFHQHFNEQVIPQYWSQVLKFPRELLKRLLDTPEKFETHIRWCVMAQYDFRIILTLVLPLGCSALKYCLSRTGWILWTTQILISSVQRLRLLQ